MGNDGKVLFKTMTLDQLVQNEETRRREFPVVADQIFMGHAGVTVLPRGVAEATIAYIEQSSRKHQEFGDVLRDVADTRKVAARFIGAQPGEIALLGPTSLGLSLFANGLPWEAGDEVVCYADDYPANVYPWMELERRGVRVQYLEPERLGEITPELVAAAITERTRLVALASCHFLSGYRIDVDAIGRLVHEKGALFSLDAIQTIGASPLQVGQVDFLSADAHKWMLGPMAIGIVYVKRELFDTLRPTLIGAWNVKSPNFIVQPEVKFFETAQRYEPGVLNVAGIYGMRAALNLIADCGIEAVHARLMVLKQQIVQGARELGFEVIGPVEGTNASGITTLSHPTADLGAIFKTMEAAGIVGSLRHDRSGRGLLRFSPHFYNTAGEIDRVLAVLKRSIQ